MPRTSLSLVVALVAAPLAAQGSHAVIDLLDAGRYEQAEDAARAALDPTDPETLELLAEALVRNGRIASHTGESLARQALALEVERHGSASVEAARALSVLATALLAQGAPHAAALFVDQAVSILRPHGRGVVLALAARAEIRLERDDPRGAAVDVDEALALERSGGPGRPALVARLLDTRTLALQQLGGWQAGATSSGEALALLEASMPGHPQKVVTELLIGDAGWRAGDMREAGKHYRSAVQIGERALRPGHPLLTRAQGRLASWQANTGQLELALPAHRAVLEAARENLGPEHPRLADYLNDLANALVYSGDAGAAIELFEESVRLLERLHGDRSPSLATPLLNLSWAHAEQGDWQKASPPVERALDLWIAAYGEQDARVLLAYRDWADVLAGAGRHEDAVGYYERALKLRLAAGEDRHPLTAALRGRLAVALEQLGRLREAAALAARAAEGLRGLAGWGDREYAEVQALRARLASSLGEDAQQVVRLALESDAVMRRHVRGTVRFIGETEALDYVGQRFGGRDAVLSLLATRPSDATTARAALELLARSRNVVLDEMAGRAARAKLAGGGLAPDQARALAAAERLATLLYRGVAHEGPDGEAELRQAQAESDEATRRAALAGAHEPRDAEFDGDLVAALARRLQPGQALVSFCVYRPGTGADAAYIALVLRHGRPGPAAIPLGEAAEIDTLVRGWHEAIQQSQLEPGTRRLRATLDDLGRRLGARLWTPLESALTGVSRVTLVPDGSLHLVNFAALSDSSGRYVLEHGPTLHVASGERDLLRAHPARRRAPSLLILADPAFDDTLALAHLSPARGPEPVPGEMPTPAPARRGSPICPDLAGLRFEPLPGSRLEAAELSQLWLDRTGQAATLLAGSAAAERRLKHAAAGQTIIHIASHGFVLEGACLGRPAAPAARKTARRSPLLLAGIALAGANSRARTASLDDDGILTAAEAASLDLRDAEWVVLSGCDTGRGELRGSEGVVGLQRALTVAGARTVVMSLWPVDDQDARAWMADLYAARLTARLDTPSSIRAASLAFLRRLRASGAPDDPSRWAAFIASGQAR